VDPHFIRRNYHSINYRVKYHIAVIKNLDIIQNCLAVFAKYRLLELTPKNSKSVDPG
jgi:hypothetical protein